ncbi:gem-associated protein 8-like [Diadema setosum]|uniref:gem-associated protein 8-like n=1 Tax=Diadema setosum TaxID=31175 RepID=UPI003B3A9998
MMAELKKEGQENEEDHPWYTAAKYDRYWSHYRQMRVWVDNQRSWQSQCQESSPSKWLHAYNHYYWSYQWWLYLSSFPRTIPFQSPFQLHCSSVSLGNIPYNQHYVNPHHTQSYCTSEEVHHEKSSHLPFYPHSATEKYRCSKHYTTDQSDVDYMDNTLSETQQDDEESDMQYYIEEEDEEGFEIELSEEMRQFFLQSQRHKEELKEIKLAFDEKRKQEMMEKNKIPKTSHDEAHMDDEFLPEFSISRKSRMKNMMGAPKEQPGQRRAKEMKMLYGKDSPAIHGMETAIQMQFDRNCDKKQPSFWPSVPLKM